MTTELFEALRDYIDKSILQNIKVDGQILSKNSGVCYTTSKIAERILRLLGYKCEIRRVSVISGDGIGKEIFKRQVQALRFDKQEIINTGGWLLGMGVPPMFHYVVWFPDEKEIMDLTYGQAARPEYNLKAEAYWKPIDDLPDSIVFMNFIDEIPTNFNPLYEYPQYQRVFNHVEVEGYKKLIKFRNKVSIVEI